MADEIIEEQGAEIPEEEAEEEAPEPTEDPAALKARIQKLEEKAIAQRERTKLLRQELAKVKPKPEAKVDTQAKTGELDETQLDYLDLKGVTESDDIGVIQKVMQRTGQTVRQALKDEYVQHKLKANKDKRDIQAAMPGQGRHSGTQVDGFDVALAKFEKDGTLPTDFELRKKVVNAKYDKEQGNKPSWQ